MGDPEPEPDSRHWYIEFLRGIRDAFEEIAEMSSEEEVIEFAEGAAEELETAIDRYENPPEPPIIEFEYEYDPPTLRERLTAFFGRGDPPDKTGDDEEDDDG